MAIKILLVDDEPVFRMYLKQMNVWSEDEFIIAGEAGNGDEALALLERQEIDVVIMDVSMPGKNGVVLSDIMARQYPNTAIIAVSSYDDYDYVRELLRNGAYDYILKSRLSEELLLFTLKNIQKRVLGRSPWEARKELRRQACEWLWGDGMYPFTSDNSRMVAVIVNVRKPEKDMLLKEEGILEGIGKIAEAVSKEPVDVLACVKEPDHIVLLNRFYDTVSEAEMRRQLECNRVVVQDSVLRIYNLRMEVFQCPFFFNDASLRSFLLHKLEETREPEKEETGLALSLGQYKQLLAAAEELNPEKAEQLVREIRGVLRADNGYSEVVNRAIEYQKDHFHQPISLRAIADNIGVSHSYLSRIFHEETELTVTDYLKNIRMEKAKQLVGEGVPLKDIVSRCGFCSYGYFLRTFKEYTGKTPKEYLGGESKNSRQKSKNI